MVKFEFVPKGFGLDKIESALNLARDEFIAVDVGGQTPFDHHEARTDKCAAELVVEALIFDKWPQPAAKVVVTHFGPDTDCVIATYLVALKLEFEAAKENQDALYKEALDFWAQQEDKNRVFLLNQWAGYAHWADFAEFDRLGKKGFAAVIAGLNLIYGKENEAILKEAHKILTAALKAHFCPADLSGLKKAQPALTRVEGEKRAVAKAKKEGCWEILPNGDRVLVVQTTTNGITLPEEGYGREYQILVLHNPETRALRVLCSPVVGERYRQILQDLAGQLDEIERSLDPSRPSDKEHKWFAHQGGQMLCSPSIEGKIGFDLFKDTVIKSLKQASRFATF
jgi:hypothetical protein